MALGPLVVNNEAREQNPEASCGNYKDRSG